MNLIVRQLTFVCLVSAPWVCLLAWMKRPTATLTKLPQWRKSGLHYMQDALQSDSSKGVRSRTKAPSTSHVDTGVLAQEANSHSRPSSDVRAPSQPRNTSNVSGDAIEQKKALYRSALGSRVRVWLHQANYRTQDRFLYDPPLHTLREAFESFNIPAHRVDCQQQGNESRSLQGITQALASGQVAVLITVAWLFANAATLKFIANASSRGAYLVLYQSEFPEQSGPQFQQMLRFQEKYGAKEMWHFSVKHIQMMKEAKAKFINRYVPPGYARGMEDWRKHTGKVEDEVMGFMGLIRPIRQPLIDLLKANGTTVDVTHKVNSVSELGDWVHLHPMQLNTHSSVLPHPYELERGLELYRITELLSNRACLFIQRGHPGDEARFAGMAYFFFHNEELPPLIREAQRDIRGCQGRSYQAFKKRHAGELILLQSGFLDFLLEYIQTHPAKPTVPRAL